MSVEELEWWHLGTVHRTNKVEPAHDNEHYLHGYATQANVINGVANK